MEMNWISVKDRLPNADEWIKDLGDFLVCDGWKTYIRQYDMRYQKFGYHQTYRKPVFEDTFCADFAVIAWMPLPDSCKEK